MKFALEKKAKLLFFKIFAYHEWCLWNSFVDTVLHDIYLTIFYLHMDKPQG